MTTKYVIFDSVHNSVEQFLKKCVFLLYSITIAIYLLVFSKMNEQPIIEKLKVLKIVQRSSRVVKELNTNTK